MKKQLYDRINKQYACREGNSFKKFLSSLLKGVCSEIYFVYPFPKTILSCYREEAQETISLLEENVKDVETERDELKAKVDAMAAAAEEKSNVIILSLLYHTK